MDTGIDNEATGSPHVETQAPKLAVGVLVEPDLLTEAFSVQSPAFDHDREAVVFAEFGQALQFLLQGDLQMVAGNGFVKREGFKFVKGAGGKILGVQEISPRSGPIPGRWVIIVRRRRGRGVLADLFDDVRGPVECRK